jgi:hypothetical protein
VAGGRGREKAAEAMAALLQGQEVDLALPV